MKEDSESNRCEKRFREMPSLPSHVTTVLHASAAMMSCHPSSLIVVSWPCLNTPPPAPCISPLCIYLLIDITHTHTMHLVSPTGLIIYHTCIPNKPTLCVGLGARYSSPPPLNNTQLLVTQRDEFTMRLRCVSMSPNTPSVCTVTAP